MTSMIDVARVNMAGSTDGLRLTPYEAMAHDLLFIRAELETAGIPFLLIRGADGRPALVVDIGLRARVAEALMSACLEAPLRAKILDGTGRSSVYLGDGLLSSEPDPRLLRVFRRRECPRSGLRYGASAGVELQFWVFDGKQAICPIENSLTRKALPLCEIAYTTVELHGRAWPTIVGMFAPHAGDITFDIDMVFSWVDGNDPEFRVRRSVHAFAPWVRRIFIATDSPVPEWLAPHPKVTIVHAEDHFTDLSALPVYNSHAVETQLHHIPGLAEHFLYSNDDMFFGRALSPTMFFSPGGVTKFVEAGTRIGLGSNHSERSGFENAARVNRQLLSERFGKIITRHLEHTAAPLRRSVLCELEREFADDFARTQASRFRASTDISVTNSLYHYYALMAGRAVQHESAKVLYVDTTLRSGLAKLPKLLKKRNVDFFCLNDGSFPEVGPQERADVVGEFLERYFPVPAPWERAAVDE
jgi:Stealth protein CR2, conserved region 2/Stealth protein CR3, conserved region 3/Stealth protein CR4, conserved region 4/Stealth protein CR1, conserved region 1